MQSSRYTIWTLVGIVCIAGMNQGLTLPLLAILLEEQGVSSIANGLNAAAMYFGIILVSPWLEVPLRRLGYRSTLLLGLLIMTVATICLPFLHGLTIWFVLRMLMGIGDSILHYSSQMWVAAITPPERRGRDLSIYGLAYGVGFSIGPLGINLLQVGLWAPFMTLSLFAVIAFGLVNRLKNAYPPPVEQIAKGQNRYVLVVKLAWLALLPSFLYGFMESSLNGSFPIYALRIGLSAEWVSIILPSFVVGSLVLQLPLGTLSDRIGRQKVMILCAIAGGLAMMLIPLAEANVWLIMGLLALSGAAVGSFYSLGLAFASDILAEGMIPTAGIIAGVNFSIASIMAPNVNGVFIDYGTPGWMFYLIGALLLSFSLAGLFFRSKTKRLPASSETIAS
ncbi:MFS transporter [Brevibacillus ginsengisoli]|uniref:MFS transporter n=1 Tax=Brevibacillus ginsengisoli TaxID=363854 RepID=UPI003CE8248F